MSRGANIFLQLTVLLTAFALRTQAMGWLFMFAVVFTCGIGAAAIALPLIGAALVPLPDGRLHAPLVVLFLAADAFLLTFALLLPDAGDSYSYAPLSVLNGHRELSPDTASLFTDLGALALAGYVVTALAALVVAARRRLPGPPPVGPWPPTRA
ncbi:hypothetical protein [Kitasatospora sp. LaBMicrA B282]|uniref:hypothetical protein n=1 Tax=Kitasatospora sp. LaBMicrA B282 TaxID=3420949 RepID=UPI003D0C7E70